MSETVAAPPVATQNAQVDQQNLDLGANEPNGDQAVKPAQQKAKPAEKTPPKPPPAKLKRKLVVDGKETEIEASEDELWSALNQKTVSQKRYESAAKLRKEAEETAQQHARTIDLIKNGNIRQALAELNPELDATETLAHQLEELLNESEKEQNPTERELRKARKEADKYKGELERRQHEEDMRTFESHVTAKREEFVEKFSAMAKSANLPESDAALEAFAKHWKANQENELGLSDEQLAQEVRNEIWIKPIEMLLGVGDEEEFLNLSPELTKKYHKALLARHDRRRAARQQPAESTEPQQPRQPRVAAEPSREELVAAKIAGFKTI